MCLPFAGGSVVDEQLDVATSVAVGNNNMFIGLLNFNVTDDLIPEEVSQKCYAS